jgi:hypothetical protein
MADEEEDDYMNMVIAEPSGPKEKETYTQRRLRKQREAEERGRVKSKAERAAEEAAAREAALSKSLLESSSASKGLKMMAKMGFKPGVPLGAGHMEARMEPITLSMKDDRGGIGMDSLKKRKFREAYEDEAKRVKVEEGDYRERVRQEREEARLEALIGNAMRIAERMAEEKEEQELEVRGEAHAHKSNGTTSNEGDVADGGTAAPKAKSISTKPLKSINVLWRGLVRRREERERDRRMRYDLQQSLSQKLPTYDDSHEDEDDRKALGKRQLQYSLADDLDEEDPELDEFNALPPVERLQKITMHLQEEYNYCFWCKHQYPDKEMDGCPGFTEEEHD